MKGAVIYARYSCERQTEQSIEGQLSVCNKFAQDNQLVVLDTYIDRAMSGTNDNRAAFQRMLADSEKAVKWDVVLVYALDRFGRNAIEVAINKQRLIKNNKVLISATQRTSTNIDGTKNLDGILLENVYIGIAEYYSAELSQKIRRGLHESRLKGQATGGHPPFGYKFVNKKPVPDEQRADAVRYIFNEYRAGKTVREITENLNAQGLTYRNKPIQMCTVYQILKQEKYIGIMHCSEGVFDNIYPPLIDKNLFNTVQAMLERNKIGSRSANEDFLLKRKIICGYCGAHINGDSGTSHTGKKSYYYTCKTRKNRNHNCNKQTVRKEQLEKLVLDATFKLFDNESELNRLADAIIKKRKERLHASSLLSLLQTQRAEAQTALNNLLKAVEQGVINKTTNQRMSELEEQILTLDEKIFYEEERMRNDITKEDIIAYLQKGLRSDPQILINMLIDKIILYDDKIEIYYKYTRSKNPDSDDQGFSYQPGSTSSCLVEVTGLEPVTPCL